MIRNLLTEVLSAAPEFGIQGLAIIEKVNEMPEEHPTGIQLTKDNADALTALGEGAVVVAGTPWMWSREDFGGTVDVLFVDEAGQMSLANVLAVSQAAASVVLLGDPQQLDQPLQGSHPEGAKHPHWSTCWSVRKPYRQTGAFSWRAHGVSTRVSASSLRRYSTRTVCCLTMALESTNRGTPVAWQCGPVVCPSQPSREPEFFTRRGAANFRPRSGVARARCNVD